MAPDAFYQADVIIIGGGIAGIVSALELLDYNKKVLILERDKAQFFGGQALTSFGGMTLIGTPVQKRMGIKDSTELAFADWLQTAQFGKNDVLQKKWAEMYCHRSLQNVFRYVKEKNISYIQTVMWPERGYYIPGNSDPRYHIMWGCGYQLTNTLIRMLESHKYTRNPIGTPRSRQVFFNGFPNNMYIQIVVIMDEKITPSPDMHFESAISDPAQS